MRCAGVGHHWRQAGDRDQHRHLLQAHPAPRLAAHLQRRQLRRCVLGLVAALSPSNMLPASGTQDRQAPISLTAEGGQHDWSLPHALTVVCLNVHYCALTAGARDRLHELLQVVQSRSGSQVRPPCGSRTVHYSGMCVPWDSCNSAVLTVLGIRDHYHSPALA